MANEATGTTTEVVRQAPFLEEFQRDLLEQAFARGQTPFSEEKFQVILTKLELKLPAAIKCLTLLAQQPIKTRMKIKWSNRHYPTLIAKGLYSNRL
jgi:hypothetical protein